MCKIKRSLSHMLGKLVKYFFKFFPTICITFANRRNFFCPILTHGILKSAIYFGHSFDDTLFISVISIRRSFDKRYFVQAFF